MKTKYQMTLESVNLDLTALMEKFETLEENIALEGIKNNHPTKKQTELYKIAFKEETTYELKMENFWQEYREWKEKHPYGF